MSTAPETLRAVIYARVSSEKQKRDGNITRQTASLPNLAAQEGWPVVESITEEGVTGKTILDRPGIKRLFQLAADKAFEVLVCDRLDRVGRPEEEVENALLRDYLRRHGIRIYEAGRGLIDLTDPMDNFMASVRLGMARIDRIETLRKLNGGRADAVRKGRHPGCPDPFGYRWKKDTTRGGTYGQYEVVPEQAAIVRRIFTLAIEGQGYGQIASILNAEGVTSPTERRTVTVKKGPKAGQTRERGGRWAESMIGKILTISAETYAGRFNAHKGIVVQVPPIIDESTRESAARAIKGRIVTAKTQHGREYLVQGIARCGVCGRSMWIVPPRKGHGRHAYYRCTTTNKAGRVGTDGPCGNVHHRTDVVDHAVWTRIVEVLRDPGLLAEACSVAVERSKSSTDTTSTIKACDRKLAALQRHEQQVLALARRGRLTPEALDRELDAVTRDRETITRTRDLAAAQARDAEGHRASVQRLEDAVQALGARLDSTSFVERQRLVRLVVPAAEGTGVTLAADRSIDIRGALPLPGEATALPLRLAVG